MRGQRVVCSARESSAWCPDVIRNLHCVSRACRFLPLVSESPGSQRSCRYGGTLMRVLRAALYLAAFLGISAYGEQSAAQPQSSPPPVAVPQPAPASTGARRLTLAEAEQ